MNASSNLTHNELWRNAELPGHGATQKVIAGILLNHKSRSILNSALTENTARNLADFSFPKGFDYDQCLRAAAAGTVPDVLRKWDYEPKVRPVPQPAWLEELPGQYQQLWNLPWFQYASPARHLGINARSVRYHHDLWQQIKPKTLRGVQTTLVLGMPQIGFSLAPHIQLEKSFLYFAALARGLCAAQLFPARYLYPDGLLGELASAPAPIFSDLLPTTGGYAWPVVDAEPDPWRTLTHYHKTDRFYGYPFAQVNDAYVDVELRDVNSGAMLLPNGQKVHARLSESTAYATRDPVLREELKLDRDGFEARNGLLRGTVTHDGLPVQLPVQAQCMVFAVVLASWEMELDRPGDLTSYSLRTRHAAIRGFNYYQKVEPFYSNFLRLINEIVRHPHFHAYPLATHLTNSWLGGNLRLANRLSASEHTLGPTFLRSLYRQQLDWQLGVVNLMNDLRFRTKRHGNDFRIRTGEEIESQLSLDGLVFHQLQRHLLRHDSHQFNWPLKPASLWPDHNLGWLQLDQHFRDVALPRL